MRKCILEGWTYGHLVGTIVDIGSPNFYKLQSDCGKVSIVVGKAKVDMREYEAIGQGAIPAFYYD